MWSSGEHVLVRRIVRGRVWFAHSAEGERVVAEWPFPTRWEDWRPPPDWPLPPLPAGWDIV